MTPITEVASGVVVREHRDVDEHAKNTWPCRMESLPDAHVHVVEFTAALQIRVMPVVRGVGNGDRGRLVPFLSHLGIAQLRSDVRELGPAPGPSMNRMPHLDYRLHTQTK